MVTTTKKKTTGRIGRRYIDRQTELTNLTHTN